MSALRLSNQTHFPAYFVISRGQQIIARLPNLNAGASAEIPTQQVFNVTASTIINGATLTTAAQSFEGAAGFLAQVRQNIREGHLEFELISVPPRQPNQVQFQKTSLAPVSFTLSANNHYLQTVVVSNSYQLISLDLADTYSIYAVINGVTTELVSTSDPSAAIDAVVDSADGFFQLRLA